MHDHTQPAEPDPATFSAAHHCVTGSLADPNTTTGSDTQNTFSDAPPVAANRYEFGAEIARGGMGVIYRATDTAFAREVAVKVLQHRFGVVSAAARRFADEARITGQLQHPAIPPAHDLGTLADGRPFLVMKLIKGDTLEELLKARTTPSADRGRYVAAFEQVCQAVAYAHAHSVIHRDLKPANVMVGNFGEVQVMDWGLAKVLGSRVASDGDPEATTSATRVDSLRDSDGSFTQAGSVLGTPAFMPPEQAIGAVGEIDARSDVFGLGALLTVILTGEPPFAAETAELSRVKAARGEIQECFARLDASGADPDLISLCKRCLAPRQIDRLTDASQVAQVVAELRQAAEERARQAELDKVRVEGEKAAAEARSVERRKRRQVWIGAAAVLAIAAIGGLSVVLTMQRHANEVLAGERAKVEARNKELAEEQQKVQARFELAQKAIATFHTGVSEDVLLKNDEFKELRTKLLKEAAGFYADLEKLLEGQTDARSRKLLADGYYELGKLLEKIGSSSESLAVHRKALALRRELAAAPGASVETRLDVARSLWPIFNLLYNYLGDIAGAQAAIEEILNIAVPLEPEHPTEAVRTQLARGHQLSGIILQYTGKPAEALKSYKLALAIRQKLVNDNPGDANLQHSLANSQTRIGQVLSDTGQSVEGMRLLQQSLAIYQKLVDDNPKNLDFLHEMMFTLNLIGEILSSQGHQAEAMMAFERTRVISQKLVDDMPAVYAFRHWVAQSYYNFGRTFTRLGRYDEALAAHNKALALCAKQAEEQSETSENRLAMFAYFYAYRGQAHARAGHAAEAATDLRHALELLAKIKIPYVQDYLTHSRSLSLLSSLGTDVRSGVNPLEAATFADRAVRALHEGVEKGWVNIDLREPDFDAVRSREDFQKLFAEVEAKLKEREPVPPPEKK
jgi:tetratricopeptide (TPR) repeat protein